MPGGSRNQGLYQSSEAGIGQVKERFAEDGGAEDIRESES